MANRNKFGDPYSPEWMTAVAMGLIPGHTRVSALGNNPDVSNAAPEDIWSGGGLYPWLAAAASFEMLSSSASDAAAGVGARTVLINGLDSTYKLQTETITLNGITPVASTKQWLRINTLLVTTAGTTKTNVGTISLRNTADSVVHATIPIGTGSVGGYGISRRSIFTVPLGSTLNIVSVFACINRPSSARDTTLATFFQTSAGVYRMPLEFSVDGNPYRHDGLPGITMAEKTDFCIRANYVSAAGTDITAAWLGILIDNAFL